MTRLTFWILVSLFWGLPTVATAESAMDSAHLLQAERYDRDNRIFEAIEEYRLALLAGEGSTEVHHRLASLLYEVGLVDASSAELDAALALLPESEVLHFERGVLYLIKDQLAQAQAEFAAALELNPGYSKAYFYLAEVYLRSADYGMAWMAVKMAEKLGHPAGELRRRLLLLAEEPAIDPWPRAAGNFCLRLIQVQTREEAEALQLQMAVGELFENLALHGTDGRFGGYVGCFDPANLAPALVETLDGVEILDPPELVATDQGFQLVQRLIPFDPVRWREALGRGPSADQPLAAIEFGSAPGGEGIFLVHAGAYREQKTAQKELDRLLEAGFKGFLKLSRSSKGKTVFGVVAGIFDSAEKAEQQGEMLKKLGIEYYITRY